MVSKNFETVFDDLFKILHFYASFFIGWYVYHQGIYPLMNFSGAAHGDLAVQLPIYAISVLAFGALVNCATKPWILLLCATVEALERLIKKLLDR